MKMNSASEGWSTGYANFNNFVQNESLTDLAYIGNPSTWNNERKAKSEIFARLDHAIANHH